MDYCCNKWHSKDKHQTAVNIAMQLSSVKRQVYYGALVVLFLLGAGVEGVPLLLHPLVPRFHQLGELLPFPVHLAGVLPVMGAVVETIRHRDVGPRRGLLSGFFA